MKVWILIGCLVALVASNPLPQRDQDDFSPQDFQTNFDQTFPSDDSGAQRQSSGAGVDAGEDFLSHASAADGVSGFGKKK